MKSWSGIDAPLSADEGAVCIIDLPVMLGRTRRFGGTGSLEWSVLQHSMLVALLWLRAGYDRENLHYALLHDAHEAYLGDIPAPVKKQLRDRSEGSTGALKWLEEEIDSRIRGELSIAAPPNELVRAQVKICDMAALVIEAHLFGPPGCGPGVLQWDIKPLDDSLRGRVMGLVERAMPELNWVAGARR